MSRRLLIVISCCGLPLVGCGSDGPVRLPLSGRVYSDNIEGKLNGTIAVLPVAGTKGPAANGLVQDGQYKFTDETGPVAGEHRVVIDVEPPRGKMDDATPDALLQWKFEFRVTVPAEPPHERDFVLSREQTDE